MNIWSDEIGHYNDCPGWYQPMGILKCDCLERKSKMTDRHGSPIFYALLDRMAQVHDMKSHDYASDSSPYANYQFAGMMSKVFENPDDAGFIGRIGEKLYRIANLENGGKTPKNESIEDTEMDLCVIMLLWVSSRRERRMRDCKSSRRIEINPALINEGELHRDY